MTNYQKLNTKSICFLMPQEVELLLQENDSLQRKLQSQEDEFRMQNQTLMQELTLVRNKMLD